MRDGEAGGQQSVALVSTADVIVGCMDEEEVWEGTATVLLPLRLPFPYSFRIFSGQQLR